MDDVDCHEFLGAARMYGPLRTIDVNVVAHVVGVLHEQKDHGLKHVLQGVA